MSNLESREGEPPSERASRAVPGRERQSRMAAAGLGMVALAAPTAAATGRRSMLRRPTLEFLASGLVLMLAVEFLLGTYLAMFVEIPAGGAIEQLPWDGLLVIVLHIVVGIALIILGIRMVLVAPGSKNRRGTALAGIALVGVVVAFVGGAMFTGNGEEVLSFVMATGTFLALLCAALLFAGNAAARAAAGST